MISAPKKPKHLIDRGQKQTNHKREVLRPVDKWQIGGSIIGIVSIAMAAWAFHVGSAATLLSSLGVGAAGIYAVNHK